jgi:hypothetical protein
MAKELTIYTDESERDGSNFGNFYGGALVRSGDLEAVIAALSAQKAGCGLTSEIKWKHTNASVLQRYIAMMNSFFDLVSDDKIKVRIMFTQNRYIPQNLTKDQRDHEFQILYYQFIKHAFGLIYANDSPDLLRVRLYLDKLPDTGEKNSQFKGFLVGLNRNPDFRRARVLIDPGQIAEIDSSKHIVLQCLDVVLGAMHFRLNRKHLVKPAGSRRRGARTRAKEELYNAINARLREIRPHFNIGISTGADGDPASKWRHPYRHWLFCPTDHKIADG